MEHDDVKHTVPQIQLKLLYEISYVYWGRLDPLLQSLLWALSL